MPTFVILVLANPEWVCLIQLEVRTTLMSVMWRYLTNLRCRTIFLPRKITAVIILWLSMADHIRYPHKLFIRPPGDAERKTLDRMRNWKVEISMYDCVSVCLFGVWPQVVDPSRSCRMLSKVNVPRRRESHALISYVSQTRFQLSTVYAEPD